MSVHDSAQDLVTDWLIRRDGPASGPMSDFSPGAAGPVRFYRSSDEPTGLDDRKRMRQAEHGHADAVWRELDDDLLGRGRGPAVAPLISKVIDPVVVDILGRYRPLFGTVTPAEARRREQDLQRRREENLVAAQARHRTALDAVAGTLHDVTDLHGPEVEPNGAAIRCGGCAYEGYDAEPPGWPCPTFDLVERQVIGP